MATPPDFSPGQVLTAAHMDAVGLWLVDSETFSAQTAVNFTSIFTSDFDSYRVIFRPSARQSGAQNQINLRVRSGSTDLSTGTVYSWSRNFYYAATQGVSGSTAANEINMSDANNGFPAITFDIIAPNLAQETFVIGRTDVHQSAGGPFLFGIDWVGFVNNTTAYDGFSLIGTSSFSGTVKVYGYRN